MKSLNYQLPVFKQFPIEVENGLHKYKKESIFVTVDEEVHESGATENQSSMEEPVVIDDDEVGETGEPEQQKFSVFPLAKVKKIMKTDPDTHLISKEAILLTAKATVRIY